MTTATTVTAYHGTVHADMSEAYTELIASIPIGRDDFGEQNETLRRIPAVYCSENTETADLYADANEMAAAGMANESGIGAVYELEISGKIVTAEADIDCQICGDENGHMDMDEALACALAAKPDAISMPERYEIAVLNPAIIRIVDGVRNCGCDHLIDGEIQPACDCRETIC